MPVPYPKTNRGPAVLVRPCLTHVTTLMRNERHYQVPRASLRSDLQDSLLNRVQVQKMTTTHPQSNWLPQENKSQHVFHQVPVQGHHIFTSMNVILLPKERGTKRHHLRQSRQGRHRFYYATMLAQYSNLRHVLRPSRGTNK